MYIVLIVHVTKIKPKVNKIEPKMYATSDQNNSDIEALKIVAKILPTLHQYGISMHCTFSVLNTLQASFSTGIALMCRE